MVPYLLCPRQLASLLSGAAGAHHNPGSSAAVPPPCFVLTELPEARREFLQCCVSGSSGCWLPCASGTTGVHVIQAVKATSTPGPHWGRPKPSREASGANSYGWPVCRGGGKTTVELRGGVTKEEDQKSFHQLCKLQIKSTWSSS